LDCQAQSVHERSQYDQRVAEIRQHLQVEFQVDRDRLMQSWLTLVDNTLIIRPRSKRP
jgi:hypothetical protein